MVERSHRGKGKRRLLANHQRSWLWGRHLVLETLIGGRWPIVELYLADDLPPDLLEETRTAAIGQGIKTFVTERKALVRLCPTSEHQGFLARMGPFPYAGNDALLAPDRERPLFLVFDAIQDPFNFGAMLRSAGAFGVDAVLIGTEGQAPVTSQVARSSAGVVNRVPIVRVDDLVCELQALRARGVQVVGASEKSSQPLTDCDFGPATAIIVGNEGTGIRPELLACSDRLARIPIAPDVGSLNAAAAAAVFLFEVQRQRQSSVDRER
ncbi:MAG: RNA methyltransferase [Planctomycetaceae bacterium]|nr:RNA methyltransferase [Planctomycetaceae bacterium]